MTPSPPLPNSRPYRGAPGLTAEAVAILRRLGAAVIGTVSPDGLPHMAPVWFVVDDTGRVYFESSATTRKVRNIAANGVASVFVKGPGADGETMTVLGQGHAVLLTGAAAQEASARVRAKYLTDAGLGPVSRLLDRIDDVAVEILPVRWVTWRTSSVNDAIRALPEYGDDSWPAWFRSNDD